MRIRSLALALPLAIAAIPILAAPATAQPPPCTGTVTASSVADSWLDRASPATNKGTDAVLKVTSKASANDTRALVRFALPTLPTGCQIVGATLRMYAAGAGTGRILEAVQVVGAWTETGVTWANQPATTGAPATTTSGLGWREWAVTTQVTAMYAGANHGFLIRDAVEGAVAGPEQQLHAREKAPDNPPELVIRLGEPGPPPTPPDTTINSGPANPTTSTGATFTFSANEPATFDCSVDGTAFVACTSPQSYSGLAVAEHSFLVRATDTQGTPDPTPASSVWTINEPPLDTTPPDTTITAAPTNPSSVRSPSFSFTGTDNQSPPELLEFECRLDSTDELLYGECLSPHTFANLAPGPHTVDIRAVDEQDNVDPTPASYSWTILPPATCAETSTTVAAQADSWVDQASPAANKGTDSVLKVTSKAPGNNTRALISFSMPQAPAGCQVASATLRMYSATSGTGRTIEALRAAGAWTETDVTWTNQPPTTGGAATAASGFGWREFTVTGQVQAMFVGPNHGFLLRDAVEGDAAGPEQQLHAREKAPDNPPELIIIFS